MVVVRLTHVVYIEMIYGSGWMMLSSNLASTRKMREKRARKELESRKSLDNQPISIGHGNWA